METQTRLDRIKQIVADVRAAPERKAIIIEIHSAAVKAGISDESARERDYAGKIELREISDDDWLLFRNELLLRATEMIARAKKTVERRLAATLRKIAEVFDDIEKEDEEIADGKEDRGRWN